MSKKVWILTILSMILLLTMALAGCGGGSKQEVSKEQKPAEQAASGGKFDWKMASGATINVMLNKHPYADAIIKRLPEFEQKTGIKVNYSVTPEENYFDKLTTALNAKNGNPDVFMTGSYQMWEYATAGYMEALDNYIKDPGKTSPDYDINDFFEGILAGDRWDLKPGHPAGTGSQWAIPLAFETNTLMYNKKAFEKAGIKEPPKTFDELVEVAKKLNGWNGPGSYGIAVRGTRSWATIHPGYMTAFYLNGAKDFALENGKLVCKLDSPEAVDVTKKFTDMIKAAGPKDWTNYTWYQVGADLGAGKAAMIYDADILGFFQNVPGASAESGNIAWAPGPKMKDGVPPGANEWIWSIAMNSSSKNKQAAWIFMQFFTSKEHDLWGATQAEVVDPARKSVWADQKFIDRMKTQTGYIETFKTIIDNTSIKFTPQPEFFNTTTEWAATLQKIVTQNADVQASMKELTAKVNDMVSRIRIE